MNHSTRPNEHPVRSTTDLNPHPPFSTSTTSTPLEQQIEACTQLKALKVAIAPFRQQLLMHPVYQRLQNQTALQIFMEHHVFAVWDFMCLLKRLQQQLTCTEVIWTEPANLNAARMINEIVVAEETDATPDGCYASHFQLYLAAMEEVEANTTAILHLEELLKQQVSADKALQLAKMPQAARQFVAETLDVCHTHDTVEVASYFLFGRENLIPDLFLQVVQSLAISENFNTQGLVYYLNRHIELDAQEHGPASEQLMISLCGNSHDAWQRAQTAAREALQSRLKLWNSIAAAIET
ncbi:DUF3050 domain-containing protein [Acaryochloris sp. IP29b_bin.148]|uniref:DUF3050 domain-containing protein n=1 Tax=Acaryochloris sp. IP29b_bin.148 TaxID=2969218 RepID=UPI0026387149|nr:DUF3050 domain-containing protein [Acaryochloris sp. IP29b_bin.148]